MSSRLPSRAFSVLEAAVAVDVDVQPGTEDTQHEFGALVLVLVVLGIGLYVYVDRYGGFEDGDRPAR